MGIINNIRHNKNAQTLLANFSYLSLIEVLGLLLPLVSYPYLIRVVGAEFYGIVIFAQAIVAYMVIVINFGFNVSATRRVSENRDNKQKLREIYSSVVYQKSAILALSLVVTVIFLNFTHFEYKFVVFGLFGLCLQEVLFPTWLYQGLEQMKFITIITFISKCSYLGLIFLVISEKTDYVYIPLLYSFGGILTSIASMMLLKYRFGITFVKVDFGRIKEDFFESLPFFASRLSAVVMERTNVLAIGAFFSYEMVAIYDLCTKVVSILKTPYSLVAQVVYPSVAKSKDLSLIRKILNPLVLSSIVLSIVVVIISRYIIIALGGPALIDAVPILQIMVWYVPIVGLSYLFGASVLVVAGYSREYNLSVVYSVLFYLVLMGCLIIIKQVNLYTMTLTFIIPELVVTVYRIMISYKYKLLNIDQKYVINKSKNAL